MKQKAIILTAISVILSLTRLQAQTDICRTVLGSDRYQRSDGNEKCQDLCGIQLSIDVVAWEVVTTAEY